MLTVALRRADDDRAQNRGVTNPLAVFL